MKLTSRNVLLPEIAIVERAKKDKIYRAGTVYIQVSACRRANLEQFCQLEEPQQIDSKYAVVLPTVPVISKYLRIALEQAAFKFMSQFVGSNINISMESFRFFSLQWHDDLEAQQFVCEMFATVEQSIKAEMQQINMIKATKKYFLGTMFPQKTED